MTDARQIAEQMKRHVENTCDCHPYNGDCERACVALIESALTEATATAEAELAQMTSDARQAHDRAESWMKQAKEAKAQLTEARRQVWEKAAEEADDWVRRSRNFRRGKGYTEPMQAAEDEIVAFAQWLRQRAQPSAQTEETR